MESVFVHRFTTNSAGWILWLPALVRPINCFSRTCEGSAVGTKQSGRNDLVTYQQTILEDEQEATFWFLLGGLGLGQFVAFPASSILTCTQQKMVTFPHMKGENYLNLEETHLALTHFHPFCTSINIIYWLWDTSRWLNQPSLKILL